VTAVADEAPTTTKPPAVLTRRRLFPDATPARQRLGARVGLLLVLAGAGLSLFRTTGTGPLQSVWEEDARDILNDALNLPVGQVLFKPVAGYYVVGPRLLGAVAALFPVSWAAAVLSISAALIIAALALQVYVASGPHVNNRLAQVLVAAPVIFAPTGENFLSEIYNRPICLHFFAVYALFWVLLWTPVTRAGRVGLLATVGLTAFSTVLVVGFLPLAVLRAYQRRDRLSAVALGLIIAGSTLQLGSLELGWTERASIGVSRVEPAWALSNYVFWAVPDSVLGFRATSGLSYLPFGVVSTIRANAGVIGLAWLILAAVVIVALLGAWRGLLRPNWSLAGLAAAHSLGLLMMMVMANGAIAQRYLPPVELLIFTSAVALLLPAPIRGANVPIVAFAVFLAIISLANYRWNNTYRAHAPAWTDQIAQARQACQRDPQLSHVVVRGGPQPFFSIINVPCHDVTDLTSCVEPVCRYLDPPQSMAHGRERFTEQ
jgi:hypothetical protein